MNKNYYFTFGTYENFPFKGGWIIINAPNVVAAKEIFCRYFPSDSGLLNCSFVYDEKEFKKTKMYKENSNLGSGCHLTIGPFKGDQTKTIADL